MQLATRDALEQLRGLPLTSLFLDTESTELDPPPRPPRPYPPRPPQSPSRVNDGAAGSRLAALQGMPLAHFSLRGQKWVDDADLEALRRLPLVHLDLGGCDRISEASLAHLRSLPLSWLDISGCLGIPGDSLEHHWSKITIAPMVAGPSALGSSLPRRSPLEIARQHIVVRGGGAGTVTDFGTASSGVGDSSQSLLTGLSSEAVPQVGFLIAMYNCHS